MTFTPGQYLAYAVALAGLIVAFFPAAARAKSDLVIAIYGLLIFVGAAWSAIEKRHQPPAPPSTPKPIDGPPSH